MKHAKKASVNMLKIFSLCNKYLMKHLLKLTAFLIFNLIVIINSLILPYITGDFIDSLITADNSSFILTYIFLVSIFGVIGITFDFVTERLYTVLQTTAWYQLNKDLIIHVQKLPLLFIQKQDMIYLNKVLNYDSNMLIIFYLNFVKNFISNLILVAVPLFIIFTLSTHVMLIIIISLFIYYLGYLLFKKPLYIINFEFKEEQSYFFSKLHEQLANVRFIKLQGLLESFSSRLDSRFTQVLSKALGLQKINFLYSSYDQFVTLLSRIALMTVCGIQVINNQLTVGEFTIILSYFTIISSAIRYYFTLAQSIQESMVSYNRLQNFLMLKEAQEGCLDLQEIYKIELKNTTFSYGLNKIYSDYNLKFEKGKMYAVLGSNGAGKSTLINLITGMYIGDFDGEILYNDQSIKSIKLRQILGRNIAVSEQEPFLLADTIQYNLALDDEVSFEQDTLNQFIDMLGLNDFYASLPNGINSIINEASSNLSGGEKQKLSLLRVLLKDSDVIILDEPTSALDRFGKKNLRDYLNKVKKDKIIIVVTHDQDFISDFDEKILIERRECN